MTNTGNDVNTPVNADDEHLQNILKHLPKDQTIRIGSGGVRFDVSYSNGDTNKLPHRLAAMAGNNDMALAPALVSYSDHENKLIEEISESYDVQDKNNSFSGHVKYTAAEKEVLAELFREDILRERRDRFKKAAVKQVLAAHRRADIVRQNQQNAADKYAPDLRQRIEKVKIMAEEHRTNAKKHTNDEQH